ncbi:MAG TPA: HIT domain-containing protein [Syntrophorhabdaceae bacterium]|nr:HIT domain-containing protein [Syntrophorhabdaceae bacterium]HPU30901.1 HIT domain-containing protein [Syntrophorhabdaceae bacterium]
MDRIWAPWRMEYISGVSQEKEKKCFLCINEKDDDELLVIGRQGTAFVIMNKFPYTNGHLMVVPKRHVGSIEELEEFEVLDMMRLVQKMTRIFKKEFNVDGLNIGINIGRAAGAGLEDHIHIHIVPRWFGDANFMAVIGETRVISEHIRETYRRLKEGFEKLF